jgi:hypothetical protein
MILSGLSSENEQRLALFRTVAHQVRSSTLVDGDRRISIAGQFRPSGDMTTSVSLLEEEPFRSLALSVRLVYQNGEPANFYSIANLLGKTGDQEVRQRVADSRRRYTAALGSPVASMNVQVGEEILALSARDVFETWMYTGVFHQDLDRLETYRALQARAEMFRFSVQSTALQLCGRVLDLDDVIADVLAQDRLPRIQPAAKGKAPSIDDA